MAGAAGLEPFKFGRLDVDGGHQLYWEAVGNPAGMPALVLHGGPGSGCNLGHRAWFDPARHLVVLFDQRNSGRSTPYGGEPVVDLSSNTTEHLVGDIERLREHLGIERWRVAGISWGTTLALAYAERHHDRVTGMALNSIGTTSAAEVEWITRGVGPLFPDAWARFVEALPSRDRGGNLAAAYHRLLQDPDPAVHHAAARAWCAWEDAHVATHPGQAPNPRYADPGFRLCFARIVTWYFSHAAFLPDGELMRGAPRLAGIPAVLLHGRLDISTPPDVAVDLHRRWPGSELVLVDAGHGATREAMRAATDRLAAKLPD